MNETLMSQLSTLNTAAAGLQNQLNQVQAILGYTPGSAQGPAATVPASTVASQVANLQAQLQIAVTTLTEIQQSIGSAQ